MAEEQNSILICKIMKRAKCLDISFGSSLVMYVDLELAINYFGMDLQAWLDADDQAFSADFIGIQQHVNRNTGLFDQGFVPRFAKRK